MLQMFFKDVWPDVNVAAERLVRAARDEAWRPGAQ